MCRNSIHISICIIDKSALYQNEDGFLGLGPRGVFRFWCIAIVRWHITAWNTITEKFNEN